MHFERLLTGRVLVGASLLLSLWLILLGHQNGDISDYFGEGRAGTIASILLLLLISFTCFKIHGRRPEHGAARFVEPRRIWLIMSAGFLFLALDDALKIHENIDKLIHHVFDMVETAWSDRIDDLIIALYAATGAAVLYVFRDELSRYRFLFAYLMAGFAVLSVTIILDLVTNGLTFLTWLSGTEDAAISWKILLGTLEEVSKLVAEAIFLAGFLQVLFLVSAEDEGGS
ncbi:MAG: hypothetical protein AAF376_05935 [Pseudomonadota bacterium]